MSNPNLQQSNVPHDIGTQLALIQQNIVFIRSDISAMRVDREEAERDLAKYREATEQRLRVVESAAVKLSERMTIWQGLQAALTLAIGALAAYLGATLR